MRNFGYFIDLLAQSLNELKYLLKYEFERRLNNF